MELLHSSLSKQSHVFFFFLGFLYSLISFPLSFAPLYIHASSCSSVSLSCPSSCGWSTSLTASAAVCAQRLALVCLSCCSSTAGFWRSYCSVPAQIISVQKALFIHSEHTQSKAVFYGRKQTETGSSKTAVKLRQTPPSSVLEFLVCWVSSFFFFFLKTELWEPASVC